jgi:hypothetical protein
MFSIGLLIVCLMIGLRFEVGGDWGSYLLMFRRANMGLDYALRFGDPGYMLLNWVVGFFGGGVLVVNLVCGALFAWGLARLCRTQPEPWLAMVVAVPYLVIVVAMGYSRQGVAIGVMMAGLATLQRGGSTLRFSGYVAAAASFHKTAVVTLPLVTFLSSRNKLLNLLIAGVSFWALFTFFLKDSVDKFIENYVGSSYSSQGAAIRLVISVIPAVIFLSSAERFGFSPQQKVIWRNMSFGAIGLLILLFVIPSSTVIDRLALYVLPLQVVIFSRLPGVYASHRFTRTMVVLYSAAVLFVWLNFAVHSEAWVPYQIWSPD